MKLIRFIVRWCIYVRLMYRAEQKIDYFEFVPVDQRGRLFSRASLIESRLYIRRRYR